MHRFFIILCVVLYLKSAFAAFELDTFGPHAQALGGAGIALADDGWAVLRNPALAASGQANVGLSWSEEFGLPELARETIAARFTVSNYPIGIRASTFGSKLYRESDYGLIAARHFRSNLAVGVEIGARNLQIESNPNSTTAIASLGIVFQPLPALTLGATWKNLNRPRLTGYSDHIEESLNIGACATFGNSGILCADLIQEKHFPLEIRAGVEARVLANLKLRVGFRAEPVRPSAGFQVDLKRWSFLYCGDLHPDLGPSHSMGLEVRLGK
jgi:hypothetical protein